MIKKLNEWIKNRNLKYLENKLEKEFFKSTGYILMRHALGAPTQVLKYALREKLLEYGEFFISPSIITLAESGEGRILYLSYLIQEDCLKITNFRLTFPRGVSLPFSFVVNEKDDVFEDLLSKVQSRVKSLLESDDYELEVEEFRILVNKKQD